MAEPPRVPDDSALPSTDSLASIVAEFGSEAVEAMALVGSYARGDADAFSGVDIWCFMHALPDREIDRHVLAYREGRLVTVTYGTIRGKIEELRRPGSAIRAVPSFRRSRILLDRHGSLEMLRREAIAFTWAPLQPAADALASDLVASQAEVVRKLLGGLTTGDGDRVVGPAMELGLEMTRAVAVKQGVLVESDRHYFRRTREAVGVHSPWSRQHLRAFGLEARSRGPGSSTFSRGVAALGLYVETAAILQPDLLPSHREVVATTLDAVDNAGFVGGSGRV